MNKNLKKAMNCIIGKYHSLLASLCRIILIYETHYSSSLVMNWMPQNFSQKNFVEELVEPLDSLDVNGSRTKVVVAGKTGIFVV